MGYWLLDEGSGTAVDSTANGNDGEYLLGEYDEFPLYKEAWLDTDGDGKPNYLAEESRIFEEDLDDDGDGLPDS